MAARTVLTDAESIRISDRETLEFPNAGRDRDATGPAIDLEKLAHWLDSVFEIPGLRLRFGIDAILGLVPGLGDTASAFASIYILQSASKFGVSRFTLARMTLNILVDLTVGAIPFLGDIFDVYWKANRRNVALLQRHMSSNPTAERKLRRSDALFVAGMVALIVAVLVGSVFAAYYLLATLFAGLRNLM
jgi:Domain of unknown function (DUF4112)